MLFNILAIISLTLILMNLKLFVGVFPSLLACVTRVKESINIEASAKLSRDRNAAALLMAVPFILTIWRFRLYYPMFIHDCNDTFGLLITAGVIMAYFILRKALESVIGPSKRSDKTFQTACRASRTFLALLAILLISVGSLLTAVDVQEEAVRNAMLWISAGIYLIFLLRKMQILLSSSSFFACFLYLCALEIIPTGALVASAIIF